MTGGTTQTRYTPVPIELAGRKFTLRFTWGRLRAVRDHTDGRLNIFKDGIRRAEVDDFPLLLWAGIAHKREGGDPSLSLEDVEAMVDDLDLAEYEALDRALLSALGIDVDALKAAVANLQRFVAAAEQEDVHDPLASGTANEIPTSPSGANPSPSSDSGPMTSGTSHPESTPQSETRTDAIETTGSDEPTTE